MPGRVLALAGYGSWLTMPREEDPQFPRRDGLIITIFPGADALTVERLVVEPLEEHLAEVQEIRAVDSTARAGVAILHVEMHETVYDTDSAWDEVEDAVAEARRDFPDGVLEPEIDEDMVSQEAIVYALTGSADPLERVAAAEELERHLLAIPMVKEVRLLGDPGEQVYVEYDDATARQLGLDPRALGAQLAERSRIVPGGVIHLGQRTASLRPQTEFRSLEEIRATPILLPSGTSVPLEELARVRRGPAEPPNVVMRWNGEPAVAVAVVPQDGRDRVELGKRVRAVMAEVTPGLAPVMVEEMFFQPDLVETRLQELTRSLQLGILIVAAVLFFAMGPRMGVLVAMVVPLVAMSTISIFAAGGGILHQISIASLVIALGMLVDNAIVVVENIQYRLDQSMPVRQAAVSSVKELAVPLGAATGTTLAAFVPMLISKGNTADFTRSIPVMIMLALVVSYLFAVVVTPVLSELLLRPSASAAGSAGRLRRLSRWVSGVSTSRPVWVLAAVGLLLVGTIFAARWVEVKFFPGADRATVIVELEMPEGTHLETTDRVALRVEQALLKNPKVKTVGTFVGRNGPKFYYNLLSRPNSPHRSMLMAELEDQAQLEELITWVRDYVHREVPEVSVVARRLEQGPPIEAPLELRVMGQDLQDMETVADRLLAEIRRIEGTRDVRHDLGQGVPTVSFEIDDAAAGRHGLTRSDVARALLGRTLGLEIGQYRVGEDPVPIVVRSREGERYPVADLATIDVATPGGEPVPLAQLATLEVEWLPAAIQHFERSRMVRVQAQLAADRTAHAVFAELEPVLAEMEMPPGVWVELGGELEESAKANSAILRSMPLGVMLLLFFLLLEFNSFRRVGIVLVTVPLAAVGVVPGLILSGNPFGFMSMLGTISLVGIVVNNAIVLLDVIERRRDEGLSVNQALTEAVDRRTRPILLTMATTVAGLSPLAFSDASLWPPLAWAMISGLMASTVLTLLVVPALYKLLIGRDETRGVEAEAVEEQAPSAGGAEPEGASSDTSTGDSEHTAAGEQGGGDREVADSEAAMVGGAVPAVLPWLAPLAGLGLVLASLAAPPSARAEESPTLLSDAAVAPLNLSLDEAMERAADRPSAEAADRRALAAEAEAVAARRRALWPSFGVSAEATRRDRDFDFDTPLGSFTLGERGSTSLASSLTQPVFDPAALLYTAPAAREAAVSSREASLRARQELRAEAASAWLLVLAIDARVTATDAFVESLSARLEEMQARVRAGRVLEADALQIQLDLESAQLDRVQLLENRRVAVRDLARTVATAGDAEPNWDGSFDRDATPGLAEAVERALASRPDVLGAEALARALELQAKAVRAERLPRVEARATWIVSDGDPFQPEELLQANLGITWVPFASGTRAPRMAAASERARAARADLLELRRGVRVEVRQALADLASSRQALEV
ncbi:MAG: efflux RND transporter permease subunit, partial [Holophagales bacterium]|nr:efflux RND transporter permease subunit [Holophagales bacterium]